LCLVTLDHHLTTQCYYPRTVTALACLPLAPFSLPDARPTIVCADVWADSLDLRRRKE